jgi:hypothetical protein
MYLMNMDKRQEIIEALMKNSQSFFDKIENDKETERIEVNSFSKIAMPLVRNSFPKIPISGAGNHDFRGDTALENIDFEALIPPDDGDLEEWYKEKFAEQNIDSSLREEVLMILVEAGFPRANPDGIHCSGIVGVQPMMADPNCQFTLKYRTAENNKGDAHDAS